MANILICIFLAVLLGQSIDYSESFLGTVLDYLTVSIGMTWLFLFFPRFSLIWYASVLIPWVIALLYIYALSRPPSNFLEHGYVVMVPVYIVLLLYSFVLGYAKYIKEGRKNKLFLIITVAIIVLAIGSWLGLEFYDCLQKDSPTERNSCIRNIR